VSFYALIVIGRNIIVVRTRAGSGLRVVVGIWTVLEGNFSNEVDKSIMFDRIIVSGHANAGMFIEGKDAFVSRLRR